MGKEVRGFAHADHDLAQAVPVHIGDAQLPRLPAPRHTLPEPVPAMPDGERGILARIQDHPLDPPVVVQVPRHDLPAGRRSRGNGPAAITEGKKKEQNSNKALRVHRESSPRGDGTFCQVGASFSALSFDSFTPRLTDCGSHAKLAANSSSLRLVPAAPVPW